MKKVKEVALILTAYSYLKNQIASVTDETERKAVSFVYTEMLVMRMWKIITKNRKAYDKAFKITDVVLAEIQVDTVSVYVAGIELLAKHMELKGPNFNIGMQDEIIHLQEMALGVIDANLYEDSIKFAEDFFKILQKP